MKNKNHALSEFPLIKRLEAVSFRSMPATSTYFEGSWAIRLTAGHPAKRLNSANPLDPSDYRDLEERIARTAQKFKAFGRPFIFRQSPLASPKLIDLLDQKGWGYFDESMVMSVDLDKMPLENALDQLPLRDVGHWIDQSITLGITAPDLKPGLSEVIGSIKAPIGLFLSESSTDQHPQACAMCVHDKDLAGLFEIGTNPDCRQQGHARSIIETALRWAKFHGAKRAWLQVECDNTNAISLYNKLGFKENYRYVYRINETQA